jgi:putative ABC transport system ATP-binding protein
MNGVSVAFRSRDRLVPAIGIDTLQVAPGTVCGLTGPSGSGKTTLLHVAAGLLRPVAGQVLWGDMDLCLLSEGARDRWRQRNVGFVFQDFHLVPELSALENVLLSVWFAAWSARAHVHRANTLLQLVGIRDPARRAGVLSRGEQQRVAIARALLHRPPLLLADEPTASLDAATGRLVGELLVARARGAGATLLVVSHDPALLALMDVVHRIENGRLA